MSTMLRVMRKVLLLGVFAASLAAQPLIPAKGGLVSYADEAYLDDHLIVISPSPLIFAGDGSVIRTEGGRAEVLLGACAAVWLDENSSFRMNTTDAENREVIEILAGSAVVAAGIGNPKINPAVTLKGVRAELEAKGAYRFDANPARVRVLEGKAILRISASVARLTTGRFFAPGTLPPKGKFKRRREDPLEVWSKGRAALLSHVLLQENGREPERTVTQGDLNDALGSLQRGPGRLGHAQMPPFPQTNETASGCTVSPW